MQFLDLDYTRVEDVSALARCTKLESLDLTGSRVTAIGGLGKLENLKTLRLTYTAVSDLTPLESSHSLQTLLVPRTKISTLNSIAPLRQLKQLNIDGTQISDLSPIANLLELRRLDFDDTPIRDLAPLANHVELVHATLASSYGGGIWCSNCPFDDPKLQELSRLENPARTVNIIGHLRDQAGLPPIDVARETPGVPPDIPGQGPGPHFTITYDGLIGFAPARAVDEVGNNIGRLESLKPLLEDASETLLNGLNKNEHPQLKKLVQEYAAAIEGDINAIDFARLYGLGLRLQNAAAAAERQIADRLLPPLEDPLREALDSLTSLHGPFILSTKQGLELIEIAERYERRPEAERELRAASLQLGEELENEPEIIDPDAALFIKEMAEQIDRGAQPERGTTYSLGTTRNVSIVLIAGATCGAMPVVGGLMAGTPGAILGGIAALIGLEGLKKTKSFGGVARGVTDTIDKLSDSDLKVLLGQKASTFAPHLRFVLAHEELLRRLAGNRVQFRWLHSYLDWLKSKKND